MFATKALLLSALGLSVAEGRETSRQGKVSVNERSLLMKEESKAVATAFTSMRRLALGNKYRYTLGSDMELASHSDQSDEDSMFDQAATDEDETAAVADGAQTRHAAKRASHSASAGRQSVILALHSRLDAASKMEKRLYDELQHQGTKLRRKIKALRAELSQNRVVAAQNEEKLRKALSAANDTLQQTSEQLEEEREKDEQLIDAESRLRAKLKQAEHWNNSRSNERHRLGVELARVEKLEHHERAALAEERNNIMHLKSLLNQTSKVGSHLRKQLQLQQHALSDLQIHQRNSLLSTQRVESKLHAQLAAAARTEGKLRAQLKALGKSNTMITKRLEANLTRALASGRRVHAALLEKNQLFAELSKNLTRTVAEATGSAKKAHKDHVSLLLQVKQLQMQTQKLQTRIEEGSKALAAAEKSQERAAAAEEVKQKQAIARQEQQVATLQRVSSTMKAKFSKALTDTATGRAEVSALEQTLASSKQQLRAAAAAFEDAAAARDAAKHRLATSGQTSKVQKAQLGVAQRRLRALQGELQSAKAEVASSSLEAQKQATRSLELMKALAKAQLAAKNSQGQAQAQLHQMEVAATLKVRSAEEEAENLRKVVKQTQASLDKAESEGAKAKDYALREADEALQASHRVEALNSKLASAQHEADGSKEHAEALQKSGDSLRQERDQAEQQLQKITQEESDYRVKVQELQTSSSVTAKELSQASKENDSLRNKASELMDIQSRAEGLGQEVDATRNALEKVEKQNAFLKKQLGTLRDLKERYAEENDQARNESSTWHERANQLQAKLKADDGRLLEAKQEREDALDKAREASRQENNYFDDNSHLQSQNEALSSQLADASAAANKSSADVLRYRSDVDRLKDEKHQDQENSHAAWVEAENELLASKREYQTAVGLTNQLQSELARTRALLTANQKKNLAGGSTQAQAPTKNAATVKAAPQPAALPTATQVASPATLPSAVPASMSVALPAAVPFQPAALSAAFDTAAPIGFPADVHPLVPATAAPLTPQFAHLKQWRAQAQPVAPAPPVAPLAGEPARPSDNAADLLAAVDGPLTPPKTPLGVPSRPASVDGGGLAVAAGAGVPPPPAQAVVTPSVPQVVLPAVPQKPAPAAAISNMAPAMDGGAEEDPGKTPLQKLADYFNR